MAQIVSGSKKAKINYNNRVTMLFTFCGGKDERGTKEPSGVQKYSIP